MTDPLSPDPLPFGALRPGESTVEPPATPDAGVFFLGRIRTPWAEPSDCPKGGDREAGPECRIELDPRWAPLLEGLAERPRLLVLYWMHRALHHKRLFRATHLHHHKSRTPTPWTAYSFSSWEAVTEALFLPIFMLATSTMGFAMTGLAVFLFLWHMIFRNVIGHLGVELYPAGWVDNRWTGWWNTTTHHDLHHSSGNTNFGLYFTWWDRWMGTEHPRYREEFRTVTARTRRAAREAGAAPA